MKKNHLRIINEVAGDMKEVVTRVMVLEPDAITNDNILVAKVWEAQAHARGKRLSIVSNFNDLHKEGVLTDVNELLSIKMSLLQEKHWLADKVNVVGTVTGGDL